MTPTGGLVGNERTNDVTVLGAGFSIAVDRRFPTTDQLGELALRNAGMKVPDHYLGGSFESWMSYLAEAQPYLTSTINLENLVTSSKLVASIQQVLANIETEAHLPSWLYRFVSTLHARQSTVITFNYDRTIERALDGLGLALHNGPGTGEPVRWWASLRDVPSLPPHPPRWGGGLPSTLLLCKLHGSLNWFWVRGDRSGATLNRWDLDIDGDDLTRFLPGREPFIVPPTPRSQRSSTIQS